MERYIISVSDRNYSEWSAKTEGCKEPTSLSMCPISEKLFSGDVFSISTDAVIELHSSPIREMDKIPGVLQLQGSKTFGRTENGRLLFKCIPHQKGLPAFLVPYNVKPGFDKTNLNKYVIFRFGNWDGKHPVGTIIETLGSVNELEPFYEYQMHCRNLQHSVTRLTHTVHEKLKQGSYNDHVAAMEQNRNFKIIDKSDQYVFTIDPDGSVDLDDGLSIFPDSENQEHTVVSVYIANVCLWLEHLQLWGDLSDRVSTIYLPDCKRNMIPSLLADKWCSLNEKEKSVVFAMDLVFDQNGVLLKSQMYNAIIRVRKNFRYEEPKLLKNAYYQQLAALTVKLDGGVHDSHDVVAFWMMKMNTLCANRLHEHKTGLFRTATLLGRDEQPMREFSPETNRALSMWNNVSGSYQLYEDGVEMKHAMMNDRKYVQITSPIRRLVDVLNQLMFCTSILQCDLSLVFLQKWTSQMHNLNCDMKSIRKLQSECEMVHMCSVNPDVVNQIYEGIVFEKQSGKHGDFTYNVYLEDLRKMMKLKTTCELDEYSKHKVQLFLFETEDNCRRKIRIGLM